MFDFLMRHKTLYIVVFWLAALLVVVIAPSGATESINEILSVAGWVSLAYVGIAKTADIVTAMKSPRGEYGFTQKTFIGDQYWWIIAYWCALVVLLLILNLVRRGTSYPINDCVFFAGTLSAAYAGLNKGTHVAAAVGPNKAVA